MKQTSHPKEFSEVSDCVNEIINSLEKKIVLGIPLGLGKANHVVNEFYNRAKNDSSINLEIITALTLEKPTSRGNLEKRFLEPITERLFSGCPELDYAVDRKKGKIPKNIHIHEFYFTPGKLLNNQKAQQDYISSNYTHVARDMIDRGVNVIAQMVASTASTSTGERELSLSCNPDVTLDLVPLMKAEERKGRKFALVAEVNSNLPFMYGDAVVSEDYFDFIVDNPKIP